MNFLAAWFPAPLMTAAHFTLALLLAVSARTAWQSVGRHPQAAGILLCLFAVLWHLRAVLDQGQLTGIAYHLLGISLGALMLGPAAVLWLAAAFMLPYFLLANGSDNLPAYSLNTLFAVVPALAVNLAVRTIVRRLPKNLFIYIFLNGFFAAALGMTATGAAITALLSGSPIFEDTPLWGSVFPVFFLLAWAEAFLSGLFTAVFVALKPQLLATFDDAVYLKRQNTIWSE
ncbi:MAG: energy-coupling factor ABC transporter permease [Neisseria sp.]|nr:energy-coupling factor ABC transporter permease [Neisseria sp.]